MEEQLEYSITLESLQLDSFRCFDKLEIHFEDKLTVFIAPNGGGKTTILDAIAEGLKAYLATLKVKGYENSSFLRTDIKTGGSIGNISISAKVNYIFPLDELEDVTLKTVHKKEVSRDSRADSDTNFSIVLSEDDTEFAKNNTSFEQYFAKYFKTYFKDTNIPVLVYYGGDSVDITYKPKNKAKNRLEHVYKEALNASRINFTAFTDWFNTRYSQYLQLRDESGDNMQTIDPELFKIRSAIELILNDDIDDKTYYNLKMDYKNGSQIVLGKQNDKKEYDYLAVRQLSAGEKALFAFVADLGLRLLNATPLQTNVEDDKIGVIRGKGIALIDEVDLHLHPQWQRKVVDKLLTIFPDVQFVMTTHSPFVLSNIHLQDARVIKDQQCYMVKELLPDFVNYGANLEKIVSLLFGLSDYMPEEVSHLFKDYFDAINKGTPADLEKAKEIERQLQQITDPNHPKIIEGRAEIEFKELIAEGV